MKITDTTGRSMLVDLVYKHPQIGWLNAHAEQLKGRGTIFCKLPHGAYAIKINSLTGADVIVFENGQKLVQTAVPARTQFVQFDVQGNSFEFTAMGAERKLPAATDVALRPDTSETPSTTDGADQDASAEPPVAFVPPAALSGHGLVYVVVRFAKTNDPYGEPPQEEMELAFQMMDPAEYDEWFAQNFHLVKEAPALPNPRDPFSREPATDHGACIHCTFGGHKH